MLNYSSEMTATVIARATVHGVRLVGDAISLAVGVLWVLFTALLRTLLPPPLPKSIAGEVALVVGAGHGLGRDVALLLATRGANVVCWDFDAAANGDTVRLIRGVRGKATGYAVDASNRDEVQVAAARMRRDVGVVTLLVGGAGALAPRLPLLQQSPELIERTVAASLYSLCWTLEAFLPAMIDKGRGHVVTLISGNSLRPEPNMVPFCAAQYAVRGFIEALEAEIQQDMRMTGIKFTTIYTWNINTKRNLETPRFSYLPVLNAQQIAESVVDAILKNCNERSIPALLLPISHLQRLLPHSVLHMTNKFLHRAVELD
ncbi:17-beta-hydroxysteroid dehydrogenase 13-like [Schistocerca gregaria]|uniref:17-beta-hydroxysteroid dehydrogenase 13-like n=1 Tax=Schistocerca gregaria TaxID=7010 RepID=UPI00211E8C7A|nr:17-beta-hydroxysteroid dehydrogenase 13-like [Schistocerca gregaria]XP_049833873.1 17-beta-hydroxysteroid dehydrogenase 13-like [Schistocerca gregaria]XP_049833882.1 17-beta-hydroxysteroid dehydrogenase 13-like [Schistocerca gregaria]XP_049833889.1 17-beta-hydroxysteroid dehydrogenase 13-like [Schistocerca gregaria]